MRVLVNETLLCPELYAKTAKKLHSDLLLGPPTIFNDRDPIGERNGKEKQQSKIQIALDISWRPNTKAKGAAAQRSPPGFEFTSYHHALYPSVLSGKPLFSSLSLSPSLTLI